MFKTQAPKSGMTFNIWHVVLLAAVIGILIWQFCLPKLNAMQAAQATATTLKSQQTNITNSQDTLKSLQAKIQNGSNSLAELDEALPLQSNTIVLQLILQQLASYSNITLNSISVTDNSSSIIAGNRAL